MPVVSYKDQVYCYFPYNITSSNRKLIKFVTLVKRPKIGSNPLRIRGRLCVTIFYVFYAGKNQIKCGFIDLRTRVDTRCNEQVGESVLIHKKGSKVVGLHCNPVQPDLLLSAGNDHFVSLISSLLV